MQTGVQTKKVAMAKESMQPPTPDPSPRWGRGKLAHTMIPIALTIAGSDSSGGAGIQGDLKTFAALGVYGASVITALTAQNTRGVKAIHCVPGDFIAAQLDAVFGDLDIRAVKIGMIANWSGLWMPP